MMENKCDVAVVGAGIVGHHEDAGSRIEELRIGGQTRSIEVQTKSGVPAYQVTPIEPSRPTEGTGQGASPEGKSSWRILKF